MLRSLLLLRTTQTAKQLHYQKILQPTTLLGRRHLTTEQPQHIEPPPWKPHFDYKYIRNNKEYLKENAKRRNHPAEIDQIVQLYQQFCDLESEWIELNHQKKVQAKERNHEEGKKIKERILAINAERHKINAELERLAFAIPNETHPETGDAPKILNIVGEKPTTTFKLKDHLTLGKELDIIDFDSAAHVSGAKFYFLKNEGALLELALINWAMQRMVKKGWTPILTPDLIRQEIVKGCGFQPRGVSSQMYSVEGHNLILAGTAEIPLAGLYVNQVIPQEQLPIKLVGFGHCFRLEAGSRGTEAKGLFRVHQFSKVELFAFTTPEQSEMIHQEMIQIQTELFSELGLNFKVLEMPADDLGAPAYRKIDMEAWMPSRDSYGEISSTSNCTDYQSRRLNIRYKPTDGGKPKLVHTVNGTAVATPRLILAIIENFQREDGSVVIPPTLVPFVGVPLIQRKPK